MKQEIIEYLNHASLPKLKNIAKQMEIDKELHNFNKLNKKQFIKYIINCFQKISQSNYKKICQIGNKGKEGVCYVVNYNGRKRVMKQFKKNKSSKNILLEYQLQKKASKHHISPRVYHVDTDNKCIIMEKMDQNLFEILRQSNGELSENLQNYIVYIIDKLDKIGIFHGDPNPSNFMVKNKKLYIIDYGFGRNIDQKLINKHNTKHINQKFMILGLILQLKQLFNRTDYHILKKYINDENIKKFQL
tara:strand:- start:306 stop:1043 length:738 start_codon:yes stop_codon:yes gene_type:complete